MMRPLAKRTVLSAATMLAMCIAGASARAQTPRQGDVAPAAAVKEAPLTPDQIRQLLLERDEVPVTEADNARPRKPKPRVPADGSMVVTRKCRFSVDAATGWLVAEFENAAGQRIEPARWALPCQRLERIETAVKKDPSLVFVITGENTVYQGRSFLLLIMDPTVLPQERPDSATSQPVEAVSPAAAAPAVVAVSSESVPASQPADALPTPEQVFRELMKNRPGRPLDPSEFRPRDEKQADSVAPVDSRVIIPEIPTAVIDRVVRLPKVGADGWREVRFKGDNTLQEPPLRLLPCKVLEQAERLGEEGAELRVSGLVTEYKGRRYLLLRKVGLERDMGQF